MKVQEAKAKDIIQIECAGSYDPDSSFYLITQLQDNDEKVRAYKSLGGGIVYLHPTNNCRVIDMSVMKTDWAREKMFQA